MSTSLSPEERSHLYSIEEKVEQGLEQAYAALREIRQKKLYRPQTWEVYCQERWGKTARRMRQILAHANLVEELKKSGTDCSAIPANESQSRKRMKELAAEALAGLSPEEQREIIEGEEEKVTREAAQVRDNEGRRDRLAQGERLLRRARKVYNGLGDEAEDIIAGIDTALAAAALVPLD
jgi:hypothetical protein